MVDVQHVRVPEDHHLDRGEVRDLDLVRVHVGSVLHERVAVRADGRFVGAAVAEARLRRGAGDECQ